METFVTSFGLSLYKLWLLCFHANYVHILYNRNNNSILCASNVKYNSFYFNIVWVNDSDLFSCIYLWMNKHTKTIFFWISCLLMKVPTSIACKIINTHTNVSPLYHNKVPARKQDNQLNWPYVVDNWWRLGREWPYNYPLGYSWGRRLSLPIHNRHSLQDHRDTPSNTTRCQQHL